MMISLLNKIKILKTIQNEHTVGEIELKYMLLYNLKRVNKDMWKVNEL